MLCCVLSYDASFDPALCLKYSLCKTPAAYAKVRASLQHELGLHNVVSTKELCLQHGCPQANDMAKRVLHTYKEAMSAGSTANAAAAAAAASSFAASAAAAASPAPAPVAVALPSIPAALLSTRSVYPCVAFYLSCKLLRIASVDKKRLLQTAQCTEKEFMNVVESFRSVMPELKPKEPASAGSGPDKRKRKKKTADDDSAAGFGARADGDADGLVPIDDDADFEPGLDLGGEQLGAVSSEPEPVSRQLTESADDEHKEQSATKKQRTKDNDDAAAPVASASSSADAAAAPAAAASSSPSPRKRSARSGPVVFSSPAPFVVPMASSPALPVAAAAAPAARSTRAKKLELS